MANKTRLYEVHGMNLQGQDAPGHERPQIYLVEAGSQAAAWKHVAQKFVGTPVVPIGKRIAELMGKGIKPETAKDAS